MLQYKDLDHRKKAFIFEFDNVLYPERDYLLQVYYLFANFIEFTEGSPPAADLTDFFKTAYAHHGEEKIFDRACEAFGIEKKYRANFDRLHYTARLPLKLLLYDRMLKLLQDIIIDRKQLYLVTGGQPEVQLNKIRQTEWNGVEQYLKVYYAEEIKPKPDPGVLTYILNEHHLQRREMIIIGSSERDEEFASSGGIDYINAEEFY